MPKKRNELDDLWVMLCKARREAFHSHGTAESENLFLAIAQEEAKAYHAFRMQDKKGRGE